MLMVLMDNVEAIIDVVSDDDASFCAVFWSVFVYGVIYEI